MSYADGPAFSVKQVAEKYSVDQDLVLNLIKTGSLKAVDVSVARKLPRWRITAESLQDFEAARSSRPAPKKTRKKAAVEKPPGWVQYFPES